MNNPTSLQKRRFARVADIGCIICGGIAKIHHCGTSMGSRKNHDLVIPLCHKHHRSGGHGVAIHAGKKGLGINTRNGERVTRKSIKNC
jgi:hypothetical protein